MFKNLTSTEILSEEKRQQAWKSVPTRTFKQSALNTVSGVRSLFCGLLESFACVKLPLRVEIFSWNLRATALRNKFQQALRRVT